MELALLLLFIFFASIIPALIVYFILIKFKLGKLVTSFILFMGSAISWILYLAMTSGTGMPAVGYAFIALGPAAIGSAVSFLFAMTIALIKK